MSKAKASKQGRKQMFEDLADKPYAQRLSELEQVFVMSKYDRLNVSEDDNVKQFLKHKKVDLKKPLRATLLPPAPLLPPLLRPSYQHPSYASRTLRTYLVLILLDS